MIVQRVRKSGAQWGRQWCGGKSLMLLFTSNGKILPEYHEHDKSENNCLSKYSQNVLLFKPFYFTWVDVG